MPAIVSDRGLLTVAGNGRVERMLLISGKSIAKAWIPEDATVDEKKDSPKKNVIGLIIQKMVFMSGF